MTRARRTIQRPHRPRGVAAVELGILMVPLLLLLFGVTEFGRAIYTYNALAKSARDAARYLTSRTPGDAAEHAAAKCLAVTGDETNSLGVCTAPPLAPGLSTGIVETCDVTLTCTGVTSSVTTGSGTINMVTVRISGYAFNPVIEYTMQAMNFGPIIVTMRSQL
jgi:Flp pilus assembly protein TadG